MKPCGQLAAVRQATQVCLATRHLALPCDAGDGLPTWQSWSVLQPVMHVVPAQYEPSAHLSLPTVQATHLFCCTSHTGAVVLLQFASEVHSTHAPAVTSHTCPVGQVWSVEQPATHLSWRHTLPLAQSTSTRHSTQAWLEVLQRPPVVAQSTFEMQPTHTPPEPVTKHTWPLGQGEVLLQPCRHLPSLHRLPAVQSVDARHSTQRFLVASHFWPAAQVLSPEQATQIRRVTSHTEPLGLAAQSALLMQPVPWLVDVQPVKATVAPSANSARTDTNVGLSLMLHLE
jgi:hypothetical protein